MGQAAGQRKDAWPRLTDAVHPTPSLTTRRYRSVFGSE